MPELHVREDYMVEGLTLLMRGCVNFDVVDGKPSSPLRYGVLRDALMEHPESKVMLMGHYGRPRKEGTVKSLAALAHLLDQEDSIHVFHHDLHPSETQETIGADIDALVQEFKASDRNCLVLPQTRAYAHEEDEDGEGRIALAQKWASFADVYCYAAMPDWQDHASTGATIDAFTAAGKIVFASTSCAEEYTILERMVTQPKRPFVAIVAGSKLSTKIESVIRLYDKVDYLILGGQILNAYICAAHGVRLPGITDEDITAATRLYRMNDGRILIPDSVVSSMRIDAAIMVRTMPVSLFWQLRDAKLPHILDVAPNYSHDIRGAIAGANQIFYNAVMGLDTIPEFELGSLMLYSLVDRNTQAAKFIGGGDTEKLLARLLPSIHQAAVDRQNNYHLFYAGGTILEALGHNSVYEMPVISRLLTPA